MNRVEAIDALLPQTQCGKCGFGGCRPYAQAIDEGQAAINRCPPSGKPVIAALAQLLAKPLPELDPACGEHRPRRIAVIDEDWCIGCTLCIQACPVDAIIGASKRMHTVIAELCSGCDLCVEPCPVDCIEMREPPPALAEWSAADAQAARQRFTARSLRLERDRAADTKRRLHEAEHKLAMLDDQAPSDDQTRKRAIIAAAIERARSRVQTS